jgi:hypothetical protein
MKEIMYHGLEFFFEPQPFAGPRVSRRSLGFLLR